MIFKIVCIILKRPHFEGHAKDLRKTTLCKIEDWVDGNINLRAVVTIQKEASDWRYTMFFTKPVDIRDHWGCKVKSVNEFQTVSFMTYVFEFPHRSARQTPNSCSFDNFRSKRNFLPYIWQYCNESFKKRYQKWMLWIDQSKVGNW